jgi:2-succinyl-5-enolpyruvyl-6-hydroxy-3-cyclohexene-1-carboxylate synthase
MDKARSFFETPHMVKIKPLAEAYGAEYMECPHIDSLPGIMAEFAAYEGTCILEIKTDAKQNTKVYKEYYQYIKQS